ncbi:MAG TPA: ATP-binding protein, partial [Flavobacteriales bacterium]|nr:ATP-binding protein [Flavobacteriales bacterium]
ARELRPAALDDLGLIPALHAFMKSFSVRTGVRSNLVAAPGIESLDIDRRTVLFRVAQEALTNVARHAKARTVTVRIRCQPGQATLIVADDGRSFNVLRALQAKDGNRLGLLGMRERAEMVGGTMVVDSVPGKGTRITASVPFAATPKDKNRHDAAHRIGA